MLAGLGIPIPMFPLNSAIGESPMLVEPVNLGMVLVVPLPVTVWAFASRAAKQITINRTQMRFIVNLLVLCAFEPEPA